MPEVYDFIIVGAGIAGLHCARRILAGYPDKKVLVLEKYNYLGGRVVTYYRDPKIHWENGAGRIHASHRMVRKYMDRYGLTFTPIGGSTLFQARNGAELVPNTFDDRLEQMLAPLQSLPAAVLAHHTLEQLCTRIHGTQTTRDFFAQFPYKSEVTTLRADAALESFLGRGALTDSAFGVCAEGLSKIISGLANEVIGAGATILFGQTLTEVSPGPNPTLTVQTAAGTAHFRAKKLILALHCDALKQIRGISDWPLLKQVTMEPLLRLYAIFPTRNGRPWFTGDRIVFGRNPIRYFIPCDVSRGVAMISYTDSSDTEPWMADAWNNPERLQERVMKSLRAALPHEQIPDPLFFKAHPWSEGCSYWLPVPAGRRAETIEELSMKALNPAQNLYVCGESFSTKQCWMEGALEHAERLCQLLHIPKDN